MVNIAVYYYIVVKFKHAYSKLKNYNIILSENQCERLFI